MPIDYPDLPPPLPPMFYMVNIVTNHSGAYKICMYAFPKRISKEINAPHYIGKPHITFWSCPVMNLRIN